jgi:hypothetical protein
VSGKPYEVGGLANWGKVDGSLANIALQEIATPPHSGEGCGDTLTEGIFFKERSNIT